MDIKTKQFGTIQISEDNILTFEDGIPGFEGLKRYAEIENEDTENPLHWLQSVDDENLSFIIVNPFLLLPDYEFKLDDTITSELDIKEPAEVLVFSIVVIPENPQEMRINLRAPIIINVRNKRGAQYILDDNRYSVKNNLLEEIKKSEQKKIKKAGE